MPKSTRTTIGNDFGGTATSTNCPNCARAWTRWVPLDREDSRGKGTNLTVGGILCEVRTRTTARRSSARTARALLPVPCGGGVVFKTDRARESHPLRHGCARVKFVLLTVYVIVSHSRDTNTYVQISIHASIIIRTHLPSFFSVICKQEVDVLFSI